MKGSKEYKEEYDKQKARIKAREEAFGEWLVSGFIAVIFIILLYNVFKYSYS